MAATETLALAGTFAGRYTIERELGRGGTASVFLARDQRHGIPVAIKLLRADVSETIGAERFLKEIRVSAGLHHPHILPVLDSGVNEGRLYFVLPHAEGGTLRMRLASAKQLPLPEVVAITRGVSQALQHAHSKGFIHRDVKPENILFTAGQACLADFGIARALERTASESTTSSGIVRGTPAYMSPEQASGEAVLDARSDVYSLGCVVYEMLTGMQPFDGPTPQSVIAQRFTHRPRSVRTYRPSLPAAVEAVIDRALVVAPADRYQSAMEFADALERAAATPDSLEPAGPTSGAKRRKVAFGVAGASIAAVVLALLAVGEPPASGELPPGDPRRVAVMYFEDRTPATLPVHLADGITEDLIDQLGEARVLQVVSSYGIRPFRGGTLGIDSIGAALKVGTIITGSIARLGDSVRLDARVVDAASSVQVASIPLVAPWTDLFTLRRDLAQRVAFYLRQRIGDRVALQENRATTKSAEAWEHAQLAATLAQRAGESRGVNAWLEADSLYARAGRADPAWHHPWIRRGYLAHTLALSGQGPGGIDSLSYASMKPADQRAAWYRQGLAFAESALARAPRSADGLALRGETRRLLSMVIPSAADSLRALAEADLRAALNVRPGAAAAWTALASLLQSQQRYSAAAEAARRGYEADPYFESRRTLATAFFTSLYAGEFANARRWCATALEHYRDDVRFTECELTLLGWTGRTRQELDSANRILGEIERTDTDGKLSDTRGYRRLMVAAVAARASLRDSARAVLSALRVAGRGAPVTGNTALGESYVRLLVGDRDSAIAILERHVRSAPAMRASVAAHPWFVPLRGEARFEALIAPPR